MDKIKKDRMEKKDVLKYGVIMIIVSVLIGVLFFFRFESGNLLTGKAIYGPEDVGNIVERGHQWNKIYLGPKNYNLKIYNAKINYYNGSNYEAISYGSCGSNCFRDWNGLIYRTSLDGMYINLYDVEDNLITSFGFGITGNIGGTNYKYTTLNFTWTWNKESNATTDEYIFRGYNNRNDFNWTQEYHFYPNQSMKIKNIVSNNLGVNIQNTKFWFIQTVNPGQGIWFNGTRYTDDIYKTGKFDTLLPFVKFEDYYVFKYDDLLNNNFNITDFYLGDGSIIGAPGVRILAIGITKGDSIFPDGITVSIDPSISIIGEEGEDAYVSKGTANKNFGNVNELKVQKVTWQRTYLKFNISSIPDNQVIDNATLCLYLYNDQGSQTISVNHVYDNSWCEGDGGSDGSPACEISWNNQPCGSETESLNSSFCNTTSESNITTDGSLDNTWQCWDVVNLVSKEYNSGNESVSMILWTTDAGNADKFYSKEYSDSNLWPYLNITYHSANVPPSLILVSPQDGASYGYNESLELNFSVSDTDNNLDSCWYNLDGGNNVTIINCQNTTFDVPGNGDYILNIFANDSEGEEVSDLANFSVQVGAPTIVLHFPIDVYLNYNLISFNYTPADLDLDSCELWGDFNGSFELNQTNSSVVSGQVSSFELNLSDGVYLWSIKCNDSLGNSALNGNSSFYVDTTNPSLIVSEPSGLKSSRTVSLEFSVSDSSPVSCLYNVYRGASPEVSNTSVNCSTSGSFDVSSDGDFILNFYVNDSAGNLNFSNSSFSVDSSVSSPTDGNGGGGGGGGGSIVSSSGKLELSGVDDVIAQAGDKKTLSLNVKNTGRIFLNNCRLIVKGDISSWIYSDKIEGIAPGENVDFIFDLNVPEGIEEGNYLGDLEISCDESSEAQSFIVSIPKGLQLIEIKELKHEKEGLIVSYTFNHSQIVGEQVSVEIWVVDEYGDEIKRYIDSFSVNRDGLIEREILVELPLDLVGIYDVYFALSNDLDNYVKQSVVLGESDTTGFAVFDTARERIVGYAVFVVIVLGLIVLGIWMGKRKSHTKLKLKNKLKLKMLKLKKLSGFFGG